MTVREFVEKYNKLTSEDLKGKLVESVIKHEYVPYEKKITICKKIVEASHYIKKKDKNNKEMKKLHIDSTANYMLYCLNLVNYYSSIDVDFSNSLEEFNLLNGSECLNAIFSSISEREEKEFRMILDMIETDLMQNEYETHAFIRNQVERFGELIGVVVTPLFEQLTQSVNNMDEKTVNKLIKGLEELIKFNVVK